MTDEWMAEFERLLAALMQAADSGAKGFGLSVIPLRQRMLHTQKARAALMAHVETMRDAAPQPVGDPAENSFEWFQREIQRLQQHVDETWPDWMKRTSGLSTATFPTVGWRCTRANGHEGPCAALEVKP